MHIEAGSVQVFLQEGDITIPATRLSDGTLRYLALLAILCDPTPPPLVCLEEPELGLHPDILPGLADLLREASERCQFIVTTHSDTFVDALTDTPESIVVCEKEDGKTTLKRLDRDEPFPMAREISARRTLDFRGTGGKSLVKVRVYVEGGGYGRELRARCREGFASYFEKATLAGRMPQIIASESRTIAFQQVSRSLGFKQGSGVHRPAD